MCVMSGVSIMFIYLVKGYISNYTVSGYIVEGLNYEIMVDFLSKMWFMPYLRSDIFSSEVLNMREDIKVYVEDGYLEYSLGGDGVWTRSYILSTYYINNQSDYMGLVFLKGLLFIFLSIIVYIFILMYDRQY